MKTFSIRGEAAGKCVNKMEKNLSCWIAEELVLISFTVAIKPQTPVFNMARHRPKKASVSNATAEIIVNK